MILHLLLNSVMGIFIFAGLIFAGFSGSNVFAIIILFVLCLIGFKLSQAASKQYPKYFWLFGLC